MKTSCSYVKSTYFAKTEPFLSCFGSCHVQWFCECFQATIITLDYTYVAFVFGIGIED